MSPSPKNSALSGESLAIDARGLIKRFGPLTAVNGVSLQLKAGASLALLGPNGAGKTTLVEMLEGLQAPSAGSIRLFGQGWDEAGSSKLRAKLGICLQESRLPEKLHSLEVLELFASFHGLEKARAWEVLTQVGLEAKANANSEGLSGGQRQRLALGVAMLSKPKLLLLDEPTTGLDPSARREIWVLVQALKRQGCALLLTTHYMEEAEALCPEVALMHQGKLLVRGPVQALLKEHGGGDRLEVQLSAKASAGLARRLPGFLRSKLSQGGKHLDVWVEELGPALDALSRGAAKAKLRLLSLQTHQATLEDLFLNLTGARLKADADAAEASHA